MTGLIAFVFVGFFLTLMVLTAAIGRKLPQFNLREISAFNRLRLAIGLAVEAGQRLHVSLGQGGILDLRAASPFIGLSVLQRIARNASISDRPPVATSGEGATSLLSQDSLRSAYQAMNVEGQYDPASGQLTGLSAFSYAAGALSVIYDQQVSINILAGSFGSEAGLLTDASERSGGLALAGTENLAGQAVMYATAQEPLIGEELFASGAYLQVNPLHLASLRAQDIARWLVAAAILFLALLKFIGVL